ncbi:MAG: Type 1 glutamine amidotransferase-like domain-containing protein [Clostridiales bacterium]|nr:Type 1 glutamine amidotransferase-like domain-containing protein [Clostridiales bacterium]
MKLFLNGGGYGKKTEDIYRVFDAVVDHEKPLLYIPLAMPEEEHTLDECYAWMKRELASVRLPSIDMVRTYEEILEKDFSKYCAVFVGGGNTFSLLDGLKRSGAFAQIAEYIRGDGIVFGSSAGEIIFGRDIMTAITSDPNDVGLTDTIGFDVLQGVSLDAHYTNAKTEEEHVRVTEFLTKYSIEHEKVIALPEEDTLFIDNGEAQVIGNRPYYVFENGIRTEKRPEMRNELTDNEWPLEYIDHDRRIARAIVFDDDGYFYFIRAVRDDLFGKATMIETPGGGVEAGEDLKTAILRELSEELGAEVDVLCKIGVVSDYYNVIHRHNLTNYFLCKVRSFGEKHLTKDEIDDFHLSTLKLTYDEVVSEYEKRKETPIGRLVAARELPVIRRAKEIIDIL